MPDPRPPGSLVPYDLSSPPQLLIPSRHDRSERSRTQSVRLGQGEDAAVLTVTRWGKCRPGCKGSPVSGHEAAWSVLLSVPCENLPHCNACECGSGHGFALSPEQVAELKSILP